MNDVSTLRLNVLRLLYAVLGVGLGMTEFPQFLHHEHWSQTDSVAHCFLLALGVLSFVGIRSPLEMLPVLVLELLWKTIWLIGVALPMRLANQLDADTVTNFPKIAPVVIIIPFIPWRYLFARFLKRSDPAQVSDPLRP